MQTLQQPEQGSLRFLVQVGNEGDKFAIFRRQFLRETAEMTDQLAAEIQAQHLGEIQQVLVRDGAVLTATPR